MGSAVIATAETNLSVPVNAVVVLTAGASGTKIEEIVVQAGQTTLVATTVAGLVYLFLYNGTTYFLFDTIAVTAITASATVAPFRASSRYVNLWIPSTWSLRASQSIAGNASVLRISAFGGNY